MGDVVLDGAPARRARVRSSEAWGCQVIDESVFRAWAGIDDAGTSGSYWGVEARNLREDAGVSAAEAVDAVVLHALARGDLTPLCALFAQGVAPGSHALRYLSRMIEPSLGGIRHVNYQLEARRIDGESGRPREYWMEIRDRIIRERVAQRKAAGKRYKAAVSEVAEMHGMKVDAVKKIAPLGRSEKE